MNKCFGDMIGKQQDIRDKLKPIDRRLKTLDEHLRQVDIYLSHKGKKAKTESEQILFTAASNYLKGVMGEHKTIPTKAWKAERAKLTAERKQLDREYYALKGEVKEAEQIRKSVYSILRQEQRERQRSRVHGMAR